jgi:hypothetical protein
MPLPKPQQTVRDRNFQSTQPIPTNNPQTVNTLTGSHSVVSLSTTSINFASDFLKDLKGTKGPETCLLFIEEVRFTQSQGRSAVAPWNMIEISDSLRKPQFSQIKTWVENLAHRSKVEELNKAIMQVLTGSIIFDKTRVTNDAKAFVEGNHDLLTTSSSMQSLSSIPTDPVFRMSSP